MKNPRSCRWSGIFFAVLPVAVLFPGGLAAHQESREHKQVLYPKYSFTIEIDGMVNQIGKVVEVSGLKMEVDVIESQDGSSNEIRKTPGRRVWPEVVLSRPFTGSTEFYDWAVASRSGTVERRSVVITMLDQRGSPVARWHLQNAWPAKWAGPVLDGSANEVAIETIALAHEGLSMSTEPR